MLERIQSVINVIFQFLAICVLQALKVLPGCLPEGRVAPQGVLEGRPHPGGVSETAGEAPHTGGRFRPNHLQKLTFFITR